jgi:hypothetical protein
MASDVATPWGRASVIEEVSLPQEADGRRFASLAQLLETRDGELLVRFAYTTDGSARRGPVTLRVVDVEAFRQALGERRRLAKVLGIRPRRREPG